MSVPKISIIIPTWNQLAFLRFCVSSILNHTKLPYEIVLHVNDGSDGTLDWVRKQGFVHTWAPQNIGICRSLNLAAQKCRSEYLVYLNDDMYVLPGWERPLYDCASRFGDREACYVSGTMIQAEPISPAAIVADYGDDPVSFDEARLLADHHQGQLAFQDWSGATWPPSCIHRKWWDLIGGYSEDFSPGFYSDIDFSMKLWQIGCRQFYGLGSSVAYHFGEETTSQIRGTNKCNVKNARIRFVKKWA